jgi:hypothetical protein
MFFIHGIRTKFNMIKVTKETEMDKYLIMSTLNQLFICP